jgi:hypothetical protein
LIHSLSAIRLRKFRFTTDDYSDAIWHMRTSRFTLIAVALLIGCGLSASPARAGYIVTLQEVGPNVVATGSGAIDLTGLSSFGSAFASPEMYPAHGIMGTGPSGTIDQYLGSSGPASFGPGFGGFPSTTSGDSVFLEDFGLGIDVPQGYVSGTSLSSSATYSGTLASLNVTPGTYEWTWGTGPNQSFTLQAVPEPSVRLLLAVGVLLLGVRLRQLRPGLALPRI